MSKSPDFDVPAAHKYFSVACFNGTWDFIDKPTLTSEETDRMIQTCMAGLWHWSQRPEATAENLSVGYWQASRVFALAGKADDARHYGELSLAQSHGLEPFYLGYAYECLARAERIAGSAAKAQEYLERAQAQCERIENPEHKKLLEGDLKTIL